MKVSVITVELTVRPLITLSIGGNFYPHRVHLPLLAYALINNFNRNIFKATDVLIPERFRSGRKELDTPGPYTDHKHRMLNRMNLFRTISFVTDITWQIYVFINVSKSQQLLCGKPLIPKFTENYIFTIIKGILRFIIHGNFYN